MSAPLAQWPGLALTLTEEQYPELRNGIEQELGRALSRRGPDLAAQPPFLRRTRACTAAGTRESSSMV